MLRTTNNCRYRSSYDKKNKVIHILDQTKGTSYTSVTNAVDGIVPYLKEVYKTQGDVRIYLYGTDRIISEFFPRERDFDTRTYDVKLVLKEYEDMMNNM